MRVMCINKYSGWNFIPYKGKSFWFIHFKPKKTPSIGPSFGEVCTVVNSYVSPNNNSLYYLLQEYLKTPIAGFPHEEFIPLSEIDELELVNEKQLVNS